MSLKDILNYCINNSSILSTMFDKYNNDVKLSIQIEDEKPITIKYEYDYYQEEYEISISRDIDNGIIEEEKLGYNTNDIEIENIDKDVRSVQDVQDVQDNPSSKSDDDKDDNKSILPNNISPSSSFEFQHEDDCRFRISDLNRFRCCNWILKFKIDKGTCGIDHNDIDTNCEYFGLDIQEEYDGHLKYYKFKYDKCVVEENDNIQIHNCYLDNKLVAIMYYKDGILHRDNLKPAITIYKDDKVVYEECRTDNEVYNDSKVYAMKAFHKNGQVKFTVKFYKNYEELGPTGPTIYEYYKDGSRKMFMQYDIIEFDTAYTKEEYYLGGGVKSYTTGCENDIAEIEYYQSISPKRMSFNRCRYERPHIIEWYESGYIKLAEYQDKVIEWYDKNEIDIISHRVELRDHEDERFRWGEYDGDEFEDAFESTCFGKIKCITNK